MTQDSQSLLERRDFQVVSDGGLDIYSTLLNTVPVAPFYIHFGHQVYKANEMPQATFFARLREGNPHPSTSPPVPADYVKLYQTVGDGVILAITISRGLSASYSAAEEATKLVPQAQVYLHDSRTLSAAQAFQVHAAESAWIKGETLGTALRWMRQIDDETELYFTLNDLEYLRRGGRLGRIAAMIGGLLDIKPVVTVNKAEGTYTTAGRGRTWKGGIEAVARQVTHRYGIDTPLRVALLVGEYPEDAEYLLTLLRQFHPIIWTETLAVNQVLGVHTGPQAVGVVVGPGDWPWNRMDL